MRVEPLFDGVNHVPSVLVVVKNAAAEDYACADGGPRKGMRRTNFCSGECSARIGEVHTPTAARARPHSNNAAHDGEYYAPNASSCVSLHR